MSSLGSSQVTTVDLCSLHLCVTPQAEALHSNSCWEARSEGTALCIGEDFHDYTEGAGDGAQGKAETSRTYLPRVREQFSTYIGQPGLQDPA